MGIITSLIQMKNQKDMQTKMSAIEGYKAAMTNAPTPEAYEWAKKGIIDLTVGDLTGGGTGKKSGRGGGGGGSGGGGSDPFHTIISGLVGTLDKFNPLTASQQTRQTLSRDAAARPAKMSLTPEEQEQLRTKQQTAEDQEKLKYQEALQKQKADLERKQQLQQANDLTDRLTAEGGLSPEEIKRKVDESVYGIKPEDKDSSGEKIELVDGSGNETVVFRSPTSRKVYDAAGKPVDLLEMLTKGGMKYKQKEPAGSGQDAGAYLKERESALKNLHPDWTPEQVKTQASKDALKHQDDQDRARNVGVEIRMRNASEGNKPVDKDSVGYWAKFIADGGQIPYALMRGMNKKMAADLMVQIPQIAATRGESPADLIARQADVKGLDSALLAMEKQYATTSSFEKTARENLDRAIAAAGKIADTGSPFFNKPWRRAESELQGKPEYAAFHAARVTAFTEVSKVLNNPNGSGAVSDSARKEADSALGDNATLEQLMSAANILKADMETRTRNMQETIQATKNKLSGRSGDPGGGVGGAGGSGAGGGVGGGGRSSQNSPIKMKVDSDGQRLGLVNNKWVKLAIDENGKILGLIDGKWVSVQ